MVVAVAKATSGAETLAVRRRRPRPRPRPRPNGMRGAAGARLDGFLGKRVPPRPPAAAGRLTLNTRRGAPLGP